MTYEELEALAAGTAEQLVENGIRIGDAVAVSLPNCLEFICVFLAAARLGCRFAPLDPGLKPFELERVIECCSARLLITRNPWTGTVPMLSDSACCRPGTGSDDKSRMHPGTDFLIQYSSGTTHRAKQVRRTHANLIAEARNLAASAGITGSDVILAAVPLWHAYGLGNCMLAFQVGATLALPDEPPAATTSILGVCKRTRVTVLPGVPFVFAALAASPLGGLDDLPALRLAISAGSPLRKETFDAFQIRFGTPIRQLYGCTEAGSVALNMDDDPARTWDSVGSPLRGNTVCIVDGEIALTSNAIAQGYFGRDDLTRRAFHDGYFFTGDLGRLDASGRLYISGRKKNLIETGGHKVDAGEVESVLCEHREIAEAAVVGVPTASGEQLLKAVVVRRGPCDREEICDWCRGRLMNFQVPAIIEFADQVPRGALGKVVRDRMLESARPPSLLAAERYLRSAIAEVVGMSPVAIDGRRPLMEYGIDSARAVLLAERLGAWLGAPVENTWLWNYPTVRAMVERMTTSAASPAWSGS